jgi:hypothetical protein
MRLTKKHIGGLYDVHGSDGSWAYQLVDIKNKELLFHVFGSDGQYEIEAQSQHDWRPFKPQLRHLNWDIAGWETGRRS